MSVEATPADQVRTDPEPEDAAQAPEDAAQDDDSPEGEPESTPPAEDVSGARKARREAQGLRQRLHEAEDAQQATTAELDQLRAALADRDAAEAARVLDHARAVAAATQRIPAGLVPFIAGTSAEEIAAAAVALGNELRFLTEAPLLGIDPGPLRTRTLDAHHAAITRQAAAHDAQQATSSTDRMAEAVRGRA